MKMTIDVSIEVKIKALLLLWLILHILVDLIKEGAVGLCVFHANQKARNQLDLLLSAISYTLVFFCSFCKYLFL